MELLSRCPIMDDVGGAFNARVELRGGGGRAIISNVPVVRFLYFYIF